MNSVIICLNSKFIHRSSAPWCLKAGVLAFSERLHNCDIEECTVGGDLEALFERVVAKNPDVISFCCSIWNITESLSLCKKLKARLGCFTALGGPEVAYRARDILEQYDFVDYVLGGEGEYSYYALLDMLDGSATLPDGLFYKKDGRILQTPSKNYDTTPPSPFTDEYFDTLDGRICYIESSRGCPYRCAFCLSGRVSPLRFFDLELVKRDLLRLANSGTQTVKFVDRTFNANVKHADEILLFIKDNYGKAIPNGVCFHFEIAGDILKQSTLEILRAMPYGAVQLEIGMQSFNEDTLLRINRKTDTARLVENIKSLVEMKNMHIHIDLIAGLTGEDMSSFEKSFDIGFSLGAHMLQLGFLKLLYGAPMRDDPKSYPCEYSDTPPYQVTSTPWLLADDIKTLECCEDALERMYNSGRFLLTVDYLINTVGFTPFSLFCTVGKRVNGQRLSLSDYAKQVYFALKDECDGELLKEKMLCDLLCCASSLQIPDCLKIIDKRHKKAKAQFSKTTKIAILPKSKKLMAVDHASRRDLFGRFTPAFFDISQF